MKKWFSLILVCTVFLLAACTLGEEDIMDTNNYSGIISNESALGYEYTVTRENNINTWVVRHKENITIIEETDQNYKDLQRFMDAVNDSHDGLAILIVWSTYLLFVLAISYYLYKKGRTKEKYYSVIIVVAMAISIYLVVNAFIDLSTAYQTVKLYHFKLTN